MEIQEETVAAIKREVGLVKKEYINLNRDLTGKELLIEEAKLRCLAAVKERLILAYERNESTPLTVATSFPRYIVNKLGEMGFVCKDCSKENSSPLIEVEL